MGIRMLHRRTAPARVHAMAAANPQAGPRVRPWGRPPLPALAPGAARPRVPVALAAEAASVAVRLGRRGLRLFARVSPRRRLRTDVIRGYLALALGALSALRARLGPLSPRTARRLTVFVVDLPPNPTPLGHPPLGHR
ncbi:hypothetical protein ABZ330_06455 [Streptomyces sp. NPDC006172]|uniref:hypothetical protein n=1 Tax=Streptomyces sp. NPDC006172 TaxID=3154470 RepID=UPI0033F9E6BA